MNAIPFLDVANVSRRYRLPRATLFGPPRHVQALADVSLSLARGRSLGVVGESGSGKSTLARLVMGFETPDDGFVRLDGLDLSTLPPAGMRAMRRNVQMVFQDPHASLDPRWRVGRSIAEPLGLLPRNERADASARVTLALESVGLRAVDAQKFPHEFSGGQRQRLAIARAIITRPQLVVADEPVSALDVSIQAQVLNLMLDLQDNLGMSWLLISHDLVLVNHMCDEVAVMFAGRIVERAPPERLFEHPAHPYTQALIAAAPKIGDARRTGQVARARATESTPPSRGCPYRLRCPRALPRCADETPLLATVANDHLTACHAPG